MMNKKRMIIALLVLGVLGAGSLYYLKTSNSALAAGFRKYVKSIIYDMQNPKIKAIDPFTDIEAISEQYYVDGVEADGPDLKRDTKLVIQTADGVRFYDYCNGFSADFPVGTTFDFSSAKKFITVNHKDFKAVLTKEWSVEPDVSGYIYYYCTRFVLDEGYQNNNNVTVLSNEKIDNKEFITARVNDLFDKFNEYSYYFYKTDTKVFYRVMVKHFSDNDEMVSVREKIRDSFTYFEPQGVAKNNLNFEPILPDFWNEETRILYDKIANSDEVMWGIFTSDVKVKGINETIPQMEEMLDFKFPVVLGYVHLDHGFPKEFMEKAYAEGKYVEMTYQLTENNNMDLFAQSPSLNMYKGHDYEQIRQFARDAKEFGHPFLFRINNEMNSDWVSYGGINNMVDPDIFIDTWRTFFKIFKEEGVDNVIWIYNPNDRDCPPNGWNSNLAYYPGNEYVQMLGVTGYNNGTYFQDVTGEYWREFDEIYQHVVNEYEGIYDKFPWIITEFASSSHGGDKAKWIDNMFATIHQFPKIKVAVWFSAPDYDMRPGYEGQVSRPYWLDETEETLNAFKRGVHGVN